MQDVNQMKIIAIIVAGGKGKRMGKPKQFLKIAGRPMLEWTLSAFQKSEIVDGIVLVVAKGQMGAAKKLRFSKTIKIVEGGSERQDSVRKGLAVLPEGTEIVAIHDGARPAVTVSIIEKSIRAARRFGAAIVGVPLKDTIKQTTNTKKQTTNNTKTSIINTLNRERLWAAQTPQVFRKEIILRAYRKSCAGATDDAMRVERMGIPVKIVIGDYENLKVTTPEDLQIMETILRNRRK